MVRKTLSLLTIALLLGFEVGMAQNVGPELQPDPKEPNTRVGTRGANFLEIGIGARAEALAGAGATLQPSVFAMYWNPAAIAGLDGFGVGFSYSALYKDLDINYFYGAGVIPFLGGMLGVNFASLSSGDITRTTEQFPAGGDPVFGSDFSWTSTFTGGYYARPITDRLNAGIGVKFVSEGIEDANARWVAFDAGVTFRTGLYGIQLGATAQNIGNEAEFKGPALDRIITNNQQLFPPNGRNIDVNFSTVEHQLPSLFRFTVGLDIIGTPESLVQTPSQEHGLNLALNLTDATDTDVQTAVGLEYNFRQIAFLRAGKKFFNERQRTGAIGSTQDPGLNCVAGTTGRASCFRTSDFRSFSDGLSFGGGIRLPVLGRSIAFDYAYVDAGELENVQILSFEFGL